MVLVSFKVYGAQLIKSSVQIEQALKQNDDHAVAKTIASSSNEAQMKRCYFSLKTMIVGYLLMHIFLFRDLVKPSPKLTTSVRLPVVVLPTERQAVKISTLLLSEIPGSCRAGLQKR